MPANQKPIFASAHTCHAGRVFQPGERMDNVGLSEHAVRGALEGGVATDSSQVAQRARAAEMERREQVRDSISTRSEKKESTERRAGNLPQLVRLPDGNYAEVSNR